MKACDIRKQHASENNIDAGSWTWLLWGLASLIIAMSTLVLGVEPWVPRTSRATCMVRLKIQIQIPHMSSPQLCEYLLDSNRLTGLTSCEV